MSAAHTTQVLGDIALRFMTALCANRSGSTLAGIVVPADHQTRGVVLCGAGTAAGYIAAADALLFEAFRTVDLTAQAPDGTPVHELHDRARDALRGMLGALAS